MTSPPLIEGDIRRLPVESAGVSSVVYKVSHEAVIKAPWGTPESEHQLSVEHDIYDRLGSHPHITKVLAKHNGMLVLERLQPLRRRLWDLRDAGEQPLSTDVVQWALQITQALHHVHKCNVFQVDIGTYNMLLDHNGNAKCSTSLGCRLTDRSLRSFPPRTLSSQHPDFLKRGPSIQSEMFALASALYEMETTRKPYQDKTDAELESLFRAQDFPDTTTLILGKVITKCCQTEYKNLGEAVRDIWLVQTEMQAEYRDRGK